MGRPASAQEAIDTYGLDAVCEAIMTGGTLTFVAADAGVSLTSLLTWIEAVPERSARVREARAATGRLWDEKAETEIREASDEFGLKKAKELAHHYRWRASKISCREYGDKIQHADADGEKLAAPIFNFTPTAPKPAGDE